MSERVDQRAVPQDPLEFFSEVIFICVGNAGVADGLDILWSGQGQDAIAEAHRFQQSGMGAAHFGRMDIAIGILLQSPIVPSKDKAGEDYALVPASARF